MVVKSTPQNAQDVKTTAANLATKECISILTDAMKHGETIFIKVHAAEALIFNNYYTGVDAYFKKLVKEPGNQIVATRVLARTNSRVGKGISAQAAHGTVLETLASYGSCYLILFYSKFPVIKHHRKFFFDPLKGLYCFSF